MTDTTFTRAAQRPGEKPSTHPVGPDPFAVPEWAASMAPAQKFDEREEHRMLLLFYSCWQGLHALPNKTPEERKEKEQAAQMMVTVSKQIDEYREKHPRR